MNFEPAADRYEEGDRQVSAEMLSKLAKPSQQLIASSISRCGENRMPKAKTELFEQPADPQFLTRRQQPLQHCIASVERHADRNRLAMPKLVAAQHLKLVRRPMAVVERPRASRLERIAAQRDLTHVKLGAATDE